MSRVMALLGHLQCSGIHSLTLEVLHKLLMAVRSRDWCTYQSILEELLLCLAGKVYILAKSSNLPHAFINFLQNVK